MGAVEHQTFSVRAELAAAVQRKIADGTFTDINAFIEDALLSHILDDYAREHPVTLESMRRDVQEAMEEYDRDPSTGFTLDEVLSHLRADAAADRSAC